MATKVLRNEISSINHSKSKKIIVVSRFICIIVNKT